MEALAALTAGGFVLLFALYFVRARALRPSEARLHELSRQRDVSVDTSGDRPLLRRNMSSIPMLSRMLSASRYAARWQFDIERAGLNLRVGEYFLVRIIVGAAGFMIVLLALRGSAAGFLLGIVVGIVGYMLPAFWLKLRISRRLNAIEGQLVETITLIANGLRAGFAFSQAMAVASQRIGPPMSLEINRALLDINLGASTEDALTAMNERIGSDDVDMVITAILIQRNTGGNLAEVLERVTQTMRDREKVQGDIKTMTSQQRLTGWILAAWPVVLGLIFFAINPGMMKLMWTTGPGIVMLVIWTGLTLAAAFTYRRILAIDI